VSCHGAGLANLCFVEPGTRLLEIFSPYYTPAYFRVLSEHLGVLYGCVSGVPSTGRAHLTERERISRRRPAVSPERFEVLCHHATGDKLSRSRFRRIASTRGNTNNIRKIRMHVHADFSLREVQGLLSEIGGVREIHSADLVDAYSRETRRGEALIFLRTAYTQS
jgi:hypothetical protein